LPVYLKNGSNAKVRACFIAPNSFIVGDVELEDDSSVWFGSNIRSDDIKTIIGKRSAILENSYIENSIIGSGCVISHGSIIHNAVIGDNVFVGVGAKVLNNSKIGDNCLIGAGTLILPNKIIKPNSVMIGNPAKLLRGITKEDLKRTKNAVDKIYDNANKYKALLELNKV
jgi:carbonic anhydrase/acetyltransferase-like protein (isoleucine patch superfamily)